VLLAGGGAGEEDSWDCEEIIEESSSSEVMLELEFSFSAAMWSTRRSRPGCSVGLSSAWVALPFGAWCEGIEGLWNNEGSWDPFSKSGCWESIYY
jgi:hypothetical protein